MKSALLLCLFPLFSIDVFGADVVVSVMVGRSVTLHTSTKIQKDNEVVWSFEQKPIAMIDNGSPVLTTPDQKLKDRLQLDKETGDLKITNIKTTDSGEYKLTIFGTGRPELIFNVIGFKGTEVKSLSVLEGDSVTLNPDGPEIQSDSVIQWRFEHQNPPVAEISRKAGVFNTSDGADGRFRDRLQLEYWTGSLTITNIGTRHSGLYEVDINTSNRYTIHNTFNVNVSDAVKLFSVKEGDSVYLHTVTEIQSNDLIEWMFGDTVKAQIHKGAQKFNTYDGPDERFRDRLKLDHQTGSLTITNTRTTDSGEYKLKISSKRFTVNRRNTVSVTERGLSPGAIAGIVLGTAAVVAVAAGLIFCWYIRSLMSAFKINKDGSLTVTEGDSVTLKTGLTEIQKNSHIVWMFRDHDCPIAEIKGGTATSHKCPNIRFRDRLTLDKTTGDLTITNIGAEHRGYYNLRIISDDETKVQCFRVVVMPRTMAGKRENKPVTVEMPLMNEVGVNEQEMVPQQSSQML